MIQLSVKQINIRIQTEICHNSLYELTDESLHSIFLETESVKKRIMLFKNILNEHLVEDEIKNKILQDTLSQLLIPPGLKGVIRGNKFNCIVQRFLIDLKLDEEKFEISFEKQCENISFSERPDWFISDKNADKIIIGMNQLDLWGGGHQLNRGYKYLKNNVYNTENCKILCVVCNDIVVKNENSKIYKLFEIGFRNNTLCYLNNLQNIITSHFNI